MLTCNNRSSRNDHGTSCLRRQRCPESPRPISGLQPSAAFGDESVERQRNQKAFDPLAADPIELHYIHVHHWPVSVLDLTRRAAGEHSSTRYVLFPVANYRFRLQLFAVNWWIVGIYGTITITRSIIMFEMTKSLHRHYRRFRERMTKEMGLQMFPENRYWRRRRDVQRQSVPPSGSSDRKSSIADSWKTGAWDNKRWCRCRAELGNLGLSNFIWILPAWKQTWIYACRGVLRSQQRG